MKFDMGWTTLSSLNTQTRGSSDDLATLVNALIAASAPLEGRFNGNGRVMFENFKARSEEITAILNRGLGRIADGQAGMDISFVEGDQTMADNAMGAEAGANFDAARFGPGGK